MPCLLKLQTAATKVYATKHLLSLVSQYQVHDQRLKMLNLSVLIFTWYTCGRILMTADGVCWYGSQLRHVSSALLSSY